MAKTKAEAEPYNEYVVSEIMGARVRFARELLDMGLDDKRNVYKRIQLWMKKVDKFHKEYFKEDAGEEDVPQNKPQDQDWERDDLLEYGADAFMVATANFASELLDIATSEKRNAHSRYLRWLTKVREFVYLINEPD